MKNASRRTFYRIRDRYVDSYVVDAADDELARLVPAGLCFTFTQADADAVARYLQHRFDLLGSGWVEVRHGIRCRGFEGMRFDAGPNGGEADAATLMERINAPNRDRVRRIRSRISSGYVPIDWQLDFKSGYRWSERTWYRDIRFGHAAGADVKIPWELSRLQHLPELAMTYGVSRDARIPREFTDQVLDWISANPPRFGVNWACTMDVGIRIANVLIGFDLLRAAGVQFDAKFTRAMTASVLDHVWHIVENLEWSESHRSNHYLGNIAGLAIAAAYLPASPRADAWLAFAVQELQVETERQFLPDGGHFEASTSYHRLCAEMLAVGAAVLRSIDETRVRALFNAQPAQMRYAPGLRADTGAALERNFLTTGTVLPERFYDRLLRAAQFTCHLSRPDGSMPQIGDNDSGRFVRLGGWMHGGTIASCREQYRHLESFDDLPGDASCVVQSPANHQQWLGWASAVLGRNDLLAISQSSVWSPASTLATAMTRAPLRIHIDSAAPDATARASSSSSRSLIDSNNSVVRGVVHERSGVLRVTSGGLLAHLRSHAYPFFGVYVFSSDRIHLVIRCGYALHDGAGTHAHDDQLSFDLHLDAVHVAADPGTYIYTASSRWRNRYRSAHAHYAPSVQGPDEPQDGNVFSAPTVTDAACVEMGPGRFVGRMVLPGGEVTRAIVLRDDGIEVSDVYHLRSSWRPASDDPFKPARPVPQSLGYGVRLN